MSLHFYDSAEPRNVPSGVHAAVYIDGHFAWPESEIKRMSRVFRITVKGGPEMAKYARCVDIENGDASPGGGGIEFLVARTRSNGDATAYCNRSTLPIVRYLCEQHGILGRVRFWIATLDGTQNVPGSWAVQYSGGIHSSVDISVLHGVDDFVKP